MATPRQRASRPRAKTGCLICRQRRIKCDEMKPNCKRCSASGWTCQYASPSMPSSFTRSRLLLHSDSSSSSSSSEPSSPESALESLIISQYVMPFSVPGDKLSRKALHHFCSETALDLSGNSYNDFWRVFVLQRCEHESVVRQAVVALSSAHLDYVAAERLNTDGTLATASAHTLLHYDKAIYKLRKYMDNTSTGDISRTVVLISCVCFVSYELIRGNLDAAFSHLQSGMSILRTWEREAANTQSTCADIQSLLDMFGLLDTQASLFDGKRAPTLDACARPEVAYAAISNAAPIFPPRFARIIDAQMGLRQLMNRTLGFIILHPPSRDMPAHLVPPRVDAERDGVRKSQEEWSAAMIALAEAEDLPSVTADSATLSLQRRRQQAAQAEMWLQHLTLSILLTSNIPKWTSRAALYDANAPELLRLAHCAVGERGDCGGSARRNFSVDFGVLAPVFLLALKTASDETRNEAVQIIENAKLAEGFCNPTKLVQIVRELEASQKACLGRAQGCGCKDEESEDGPGKGKGWSPLDTHAEANGGSLEGDTLGFGSLFATSGFGRTI